MATKTPVRPSLTDAQLAEMMSLLRGSDSVELKLTVPAAQQRAAIRELGLDALDAQIRQVVFFDTPDLALDKAGVVVRARRIQGRIGDSVIKLRPLDPERGRQGRPAAQRVRRRGRRDPRRIRVLGTAEVRRPTPTRSARCCSASARCASSTPRSSAPSIGRMLPRGSSWTISRCSGRSSCSS